MTARLRPGRSSRAALFAVTLWAAFATLAASDPGIEATRSRLTITFREENVPVSAPFTRFSGHIDYDPRQPAAAQASIQVSTASLELGSPAYDAELRGKDWLDSAQFPTATFVSSAMQPAAGGGLLVRGTLSIKGRSETLSVPVRISRDGSASVFDGAIEISRGAFGIGGPQWNGVVNDRVEIRFHLVE